MSSIAVRTYLTPEEYLAFERKATTKHEYLSLKDKQKRSLKRSGRRIYGEHRCLFDSPDRTARKD